MTNLSHLLGLDQQFCERRLLPGTGGYLVARQTGGGGWQIAFTTSPHVVLGNVTATQGVEFGQLLIQGSDDVMRTLTGPASANLVLQTLASGAVVFAPIPTASVPDPLSVTNLNATNYILGTGVFTGVPQFTGLATGSPTFLLGLDGSGNMVQSTPATTGSQCVMFFEAPTSPSAATPNATTTAGSLLTIGNEITSSLSPGALINATNSQTLAVVQPGFYLIDYCGQIASNGNVAIFPSIQLLINGIIVNNGDTRPAITTGTPNRNTMGCVGFDARRMPAATTIQLQVAAGSGSNLSAYEVRIRFTRIGD